MAIKRNIHNPIIKKTSASKDLENINGPSLARMPDWNKSRLGEFHLYFAHHRGKYIRLAYANKIEGPWSIYENGVLNLNQLKTINDHIASPDIHIDNENKKIFLFFHGIKNKKQKTFFATSNDGLVFECDERIVADFYLKVIKVNNKYIGVTKGGDLWISENSQINSKYIRVPCNIFGNTKNSYNDQGDIRHAALDFDNKLLNIYFTKIGDAPEKIYKIQIDPKLHPIYWKPENEMLVLKPETSYEGNYLPLERSKPGMSKKHENALRDPAIFNFQDKKYLIYCGKGEANICVAELDVE